MAIPAVSQIAYLLVRGCFNFQAFRVRSGADESSGETPSRPLAWVVMPSAGHGARQRQGQQHFIGRPYKPANQQAGGQSARQSDQHPEFHIVSPPLHPPALRRLHWPSLMLLGGTSMLAFAVTLAVFVQLAAQAAVADKARPFADAATQPPRLLLGGVVPLYPPLFAPGAPLGHNGLLELWWSQATDSPFAGDAFGAESAAVVGSTSAAGSARALGLAGGLLAASCAAYALLLCAALRSSLLCIATGRAVLMLCVCMVLVAPPCTPFLLKGLLLDVPLLLLAWRGQSVLQAGHVHAHPLSDRFFSWTSL